jgi:hypothetical protein
LPGEVQRAGRHPLGRDAEAVAAAGLHRLPYSERPGQRAQQGTRGDHDSIVPGAPAGPADHAHLPRTVLQGGHVSAFDDPAAAGPDRLGQGPDVVRRVQEALPANLHGRPDMAGQRRFQDPGAPAGDPQVVDVLAGVGELSQFGQQPAGVPLAGETGEEGARRFRRRGHPAGGQRVERVQRPVVQRHVGGHAAPPPAGRAVLDERGEEPEQVAVRPQREIHRRPGAQHRPQAVSQHRRFRQRCGEGRGQPPGVAPRGAGADVVALVDGDAYAGLLQEPGGGQPHHAGPDDGDLAR